MIRRLLCRVLGHQPAPETVIDGHSWRWLICTRCHRDLSPISDPSSEFRRLISSWPRLSDRLAAPAIERASRRGWDQASAGRTSPSPKAADAESASAPSGASR